MQTARHQFGHNDDSGQNLYAFVTSQAHTRAHLTQTSYDYGVGRPTSSTDVNGVTTNSYYKDPQSQLTAVRCSKVEPMDKEDTLLIPNLNRP